MADGAKAKRDAARAAAENLEPPAEEADHAEGHEEEEFSDDVCEEELEVLEALLGWVHS